MNPVVYTLGSIQLHAFTAWIMAGVAVGITILLAAARAHHQKLLPWLDVAVGAVVGGLIGARTVHVWLNWSYFSGHTDQIPAISSGGLDWHGAVICGLLIAFVVAGLRRVPLVPLMDTFALVLPIGAIAVWLACGAANTGYGLEVRTLADFPSWLVTESPDVYGVIAPRLNLPPIGIFLAVLVLIFVAVLTVFHRLRVLRLWLALGLYGLGMFVIDFFRAEYVPIWFDHRADQILDVAIALLSILTILIFAVWGLIRVHLAARRATRRTTRGVFSQGV